MTGKKEDAAKSPNWAPETQLVHGGALRSQFGETSEALFLTSGFRYRCAEDAAARFAGRQPGFTDSRWFRQRGVPAYGLSPFSIDAGDLHGIHGEDEIDAFDEALDDGAEALALELQELERENMRQIADAFTTALASDLITADDFA